MPDEITPEQYGAALDVVRPQLLAPVMSLSRKKFAELYWAMDRARPGRRQLSQSDIVAIVLKHRDADAIARAIAGLVGWEV